VLAITKVVRDIDEGWVFDPSFNLPVRNDRMTIDPRGANASEAMYLLIDLLDVHRNALLPIQSSYP